MDSNGGDNFMFATQTHVMSEELLNALDMLIDLSAGPTDEMCKWLLNLLKTVDPGDEFTVTADQAKWLIDNAQKSLEEYPDKEDQSYQDHQDYLNLIDETFDDYANFLRLSQNDSGDSDIFRIMGSSKEK